VVHNLLSNAAKAAPQGGSIRVTVRPNPGGVRVGITNPGVTLDPKIRASLFQPFTKSGAGGYQTGAGLGLSVVDALVKANRGSVRATARRNSVTFSFTIPRWTEEDRK
jgi:signal transduction histidine kinase